MFSVAFVIALSTEMTFLWYMCSSCITDAIEEGGIKSGLLPFSFFHLSKNTVPLIAEYSPRLPIC